MAISEIITVDAAGAIAQLDAFATAAEEAAAKFAAAQDKIRAGFGGGAGAAGADKLAASMDKAAASIDSAVARINASMDKLGGSADKAAAGVDRLGAAGDKAGSGLDRAAAGADAAAASSDRLAGSADAGAAALDRQAVAAARLRDVTLEQDAASASASRSAKQAATDAEAAQRKYEMLALGGAVAVGYGIYKAAQLQTQVTKLYTSAGEAQKNLPMMTQGILGLSGSTATSQSELSSGAYMIESAGFHGQDALTILKAAAQGAKAEGAPLGEVGNALTSLMVSYGMKPNQATAAMNQIITMVGSGKMTMAGAAGALPNLLPIGAQAGLSFGQVGGALATMTRTGMSPDQASQNLAHTIGALQGPSNVQTLEMQQLGINSVQLSKNLGKTGLTGAITQVETAIMKHMGPAGMVLLNSFNSSKLAAQSANQEIAAMPPALQKAAQGYMDGAVSSKAWRTELQAMPPLQANILKQFATTADAAHGFNNQLKAGGGNAQTFVGALQKAMGGQVGRNVALMLGGANMPAFVANAQAVSQAAKDAGQNVKGWSDIQHTFNFQLQSFKYSAEAAATTVGTALLPAATTAMSVLAKGGSFLAGHKTLTVDVALGAGALGALALIKKLSSPIVTGLQMVGKVAETLKIPGLDKLANIGKGSASGVMADAAAGNQRAGTTMLEAAGGMQRAADTMVGADAGKGGGFPGVAQRAGSAASTGEGAATAAAGSAGIKGLFKDAPAVFSAAAGPVLQGIIAGLVIKGVGDAIAPAGSTAGKYNAMLQKTPATNQSSLMPSIFGGYEGKLMGSIGPAVGNFINRGLSAASQMFTVPFGALLKSAQAPAGPLGPRGGPPDTYRPPASTAPAKVPAPDTSAVVTAHAAVGAAMNGIRSTMSQAIKPAKIPAPDFSLLASGKGKAQQEAQAIQTAAENALKKPVKPAAPDLSPYAAAKGPATADGASMSAGFAAGIEAGKAAAVAAAADVAAAASAAMKVTLNSHSPSKVTEQTGVDFTTGFTSGVKKAASTAKAAAVTLSASAITSLTQGLQGGSAAINAALQAALGKAARPQDITTIMATISTLKGDVAKALASGQISGAQDSALTKMLTRDNTKLQALSAQRAQLETEITDAQQIAQAAISSASIMNAGQATPYDPSTVVSSYQTVQGMQYQAQQQAAFAQQVGQLKSMGLNATSLNQIVQSGASSGLPVAQGLTSGGKSAIDSVNKLQSQIHASAAKLGNEAAGPMYQAGVQAAQGLAAGIMSQLSAVDAAIKNMANSMVQAIKSALKSHSPSQVFHDEALSIPQGVASGVDAGTPIAAAAVARMGNSLGSRLSPYHPGLAYGHPANGGSSGGSGGGANVTIHMTVMGSVMSEHDLVQTVQNGLLKHSSNNWQAGLVLPGRRT